MGTQEHASGIGNRSASTLPTFLVLGAARCGTTSLHNYLDQHPEIFMSSPKETNFFAYKDREMPFQGPKDSETIDLRRIRTRKEYLQIFAESGDEEARGESSPNYLYEPSTVSAIRAELSDPKFIVGFREPARRAFSDFLNMKKLGWEPLERFSDALEAEEERIANDWGPFYHYRAKGNYATQLERYLDAFDRSQFFFYLFRELKEDPVSLVQEIYEFLDVDMDYAPAVNRKHNASGVPRSRRVHDLLSGSGAVQAMRGLLPDEIENLIVESYQSAFLRRRELDPAQRLSLLTHYEEEIDRLEDLIDRDLSHWYP